MKKNVTIAVDGPSGAGKSTLCKMLAAKYSIIHLDTGALYRAIGAYALLKGADTSSVQQVVPLLGEIRLDVRYDNGVQRVFVNGEDYSDTIRRPEMSMAASNVSALQPVRDFLLDVQRSFAATRGVVMDGRDIGTVVLPDADVKIFMTADPSSRARRRYDELVAKGFSPNYDDLYNEILRRDTNDSTRVSAPLRKAEDAVKFINGDGIEQSFKKLCTLIEEKLK